MKIALKTVNTKLSRLSGREQAYCQSMAKEANVETLQDFIRLKGCMRIEASFANLRENKEPLGEDIEKYRYKETKF